MHDGIWIQFGKLCFCAVLVVIAAVIISMAIAEPKLPICTQDPPPNACTIKPL